MAATMDAVLAALLEDILKDPLDGPVQISFNASLIESTLDFLAADDHILNVLAYDENGTDKAIHPMRIHKIKLLREFIKDRNIKRLPLDSSSFVIDDYQRFITW